MLRSDLVATFVSIIESGSLNAAATRLGLSRSVVSDRLSALETDLGCNLVTRSTHGLSLTPSGELFLTHAREILAAMESARDALADAGSSPSGKLRIAIPLSLGAEWLTPLFVSFLERHTLINLEIAASDTTVDIVQEGFDLAIRSARLSDSDLIARHLTTGRRILVCSPAYAARHGLPKTLAELSSHHCLGRRNRRDSLDWSFETGKGLRAARINSRFDYDNALLGREAAKAGMGLVVLPTFAVARDLVAGLLIAVTLEAEPSSDTIVAVYPQANRSMPRIRALLDHLEAGLGDPPQWDRDLAQAGIISLD